MLYRLMADAVLVVHLLFILFVVFGGLLVLRWRRLAWLHIPAAAWGVLIEFAHWPCPLTPWEQHLRRLGGEEGYEGGFIDHYVASVIYPDGLTRSHQIILGAVVLAINVAVYFWICRRALRHKRRAAKDEDRKGV